MLLFIGFICAVDLLISLPHPFTVDVFIFFDVFIPHYENVLFERC